MAVKAVAWDIDGTLIDSEPAHHRALIAVCAGYGLDLSNVPEERFRGVHARDIWRAIQAGLPADLPETVWIDAVEDGFAARAPQVDAKPFAIETMRRLAARGVPQCAVSNSSRRVVDANLKALGVASMLAFSISLDDVTNGKPSPEPYEAACRRLGVAPNDVVAVEDSVTGARAARAAGAFVVGYGPAADAAECDRVTDDLRLVAELLGA